MLRIEFWILDFRFWILDLGLSAEAPAMIGGQPALRAPQSAP
jgi:hypothetical protein